MLSRSIVPSPKTALSLQQALELTNIYLENAYKTVDRNVVLVLCHDAEVALSQAKAADKKYPAHLKDLRYRTLCNGIVAAYIDLGKLLECYGYPEEADAIYKKTIRWGGTFNDPGRLAQSSLPNRVVLEGALIPGGSLPTGSKAVSRPGRQEKHLDIIAIPAYIFVKNVRPHTIDFKPPEAYERLRSTPQLACCLGLLQLTHSPDETMDPSIRKWLQATTNDTEEQERLRIMARDVVRTFKRDELKDSKIVSEVMYLAPVLDKDTFQDLLREFHSGIGHSDLLNVHYLEGLAQLIQGAEPGYLDADDLVKILELLSSRLRNTHQQSTHHMHQLTLAVSQVLDAMADARIMGLDREKLHEPLSSYLSGLQTASDPYLVYQAAYAYQALLCIPDNETVWQAAMRRTGKVIQGVSGLVSAVKGLDLIKFIEGLEDIQKGLSEATKVVEVIKNVYDDVLSLSQSGRSFLNCIKEGLSFERKRDWYSALRGVDTLIQDGELVALKELVYEAPCRLDAAFQWGLCQRLGDIAANSLWDMDTRQGAITFLGEIYRNDDVWGQQASTKQWIISIIIQLSSSTEDNLQVHANTILKELESDGDDKKQDLYRVSLDQGAISFPLKVTLPDLASPSLLDRVQNRPDVEGNLRLFRKFRSTARGTTIYVPPQAKASIQAPDDSEFPLMEKVYEFLESEQKVFLLLGDSGAGKSTFGQELEFQLWQSYKSKTGRIPLYINLPAIDRPEHDMISKQLRRAEFTEPQIRELKLHRKFVLICDGYDESQQTYNLYRSNRLNRPGEWDAQMVISCRTEYLGADYRDRFQPGDRNRQSEPSLFQEAVIMPFSPDQVESYIKQYVSLHQPLWQVEDYKKALEHIPSLRELMKNPFLMALSLEVLPRMVDPNQQLSSARITRVALYDQFVEQWLERGKQRLGEKDMSPKERSIFESLSEEGFTQNGIDFLKRLSLAIYRKQGGQPVVEYSRFKDDGSWKEAFFGREDKLILREACPLTRKGNQYRFIHRSILEYGLALAVFDPQDSKGTPTVDQTWSRRASISSFQSFEILDTEEDACAVDLGPDPDSPLVWRNLVNDYSLLQFLEERVQQEPVFKEQLLEYIEYSKSDKKWRAAAANAMTILVRAGVQFIGTDLRGVQIPGADLTNGVFDSVQFQGSDLRKANLKGVWMRQADLGGSRMAGVRFGEHPYLTESSGVETCAYSPNGLFLAVGLRNGDISLYTTTNWEKFTTMTGHGHVVQHVVYSPDGNMIASGSRDMTIRLWDPATGTCQMILTGHTDEVNKIDFSPTGDQIASTSDDQTVKLWDPVTGVCRRILSGHTDAVVCVVHSPRDKQLASAGLDHTIRLWDLETGTCSRILFGHGNSIWDIVYSTHGDQLATASYDMTVRLWDVETGICSRVFTGHSSGVGTVAFSPKGDQLVSGSVDATVRLWDIETGICLHTLAGHSDAVHCVVYSRQSGQITSTSGDMTVRFWDVSAAAFHRMSNGHTTDASSVTWSPSGNQIASGSLDNTIRLWDAKTGACIRIIKDHRNGVQCVAYSHQGDMIASGSSDTSARLWDVQTGACVGAFIGHGSWVHCVVFSPHDDRIATASSDTTVRVWEVASGSCLLILTGHQDEVFCVTYSSDGNQLVSGGKDREVRVWDVESGVCTKVLRGHANWIRDVVYSPQGTQLAVADDSCNVRLWDLVTGDCLRELTGHTHSVTSVIFIQQGNKIVSSSYDKTVRIWDVATGECQAIIQCFHSGIWSMAWKTIEDVDHLVIGCADGTVLMWKIVQEGDAYQAKPCWSASNGSLIMTGASLQGVHGLTQLKTRLLKQRGAVGEPEFPAWNAINKVVATASVISKLEQLNCTSELTTPDEHSKEQQGEQSDESED